MRGFELRYMSPETAEQITSIIDNVISGKDKKTGEHILDAISHLLPIERMSTDSLRTRVEGLHFASEVIWQKILDTGKYNRQQIVQMAKLKPLSYYHYLTGSREPVNLVLTRDDYLNDPATAMTKLRDDIIGLARVVPEIFKN